MKVLVNILNLLFWICIPCCCPCVRKTCRSFLFILPLTLFLVISITAIFGVIPMLITTLDSSQQRAKETANFQFDTLGSFLDVKLKSIQMNTDILVQEWNEGRVTLSDASILQHEKLYTHITAFGNTFCSYIFGDYGGHDSQYFGYDFVLTDSGEKNYRYWEQWKGSTSLDVWNTFPNGTENYGSLSKSISNFDVRIRPYFQPNRTEGYFGAPYASASGHIQIYYAKPFQDQTEQTKNIGVVKNNLSLQIITQYLISVFKSSLSVIIEANGEVIGTSDTDLVPFQIDEDDDQDNKRILILNQDYIKDEKIIDIFTQIFGLEPEPDRDYEEEPFENDEFLLDAKKIVSNSKYYATATPYAFTENGGNIKWTVIQFENVSDIYTSVYITFAVTIGSALILILLSSIFGCCMIHFLVIRPIGHLKHQMKDAERLRLDGLKTRIRICYPTTWPFNPFCSCCFIPTEVNNLQKKFYHLVEKLIEYRMFLPAHIKEQENYLSRNSLSKEEKKMMNLFGFINNTNSIHEEGGDSVSNNSVGGEDGTSVSTENTYSGLEGGNVNSNSSSISSTSSFRSGKSRTLYSSSKAMKNKKTNITLQTRGMAIVVVQFILDASHHHHDENTSRFPKSFSSRIGDTFIKAYDGFLSTVEKVCMKHRGQIIHFDEDYITVGFNTSIYENLRNSYNFKALQFCEELRHLLNNNMKSQLFFRIGFSSAKYDAMITFGTKNYRTRRAGKVYLLAKKLCELGGVGQIICDIENLGLQIPKQYIFKPHKVVLLNFSNGDDHYLMSGCNSVVHSVMFDHCVQKARNEEWMYTRKTEEMIGDERTDMNVLIALIEGRKDDVRDILKVRIQVQQQQESSVSSESEEEEEGGEDYYVKNNGKNNNENSDAFVIPGERKKEKKMKNAYSSGSLITFQYRGDNILIGKIVRRLNMRGDADYGKLIEEIVQNIKNGMAQMESGLGFKLIGIDHIEMF